MQNRKIKFRGLYEYGEKPEMVYGDLVTAPMCRYHGDLVIDAYDDEFQHYRPIQNPQTIGQYSNVDDCHGRGIYEGDILTCDDGANYLVMYYLGWIAVRIDHNVKDMKYNIYFWSAGFLERKWIVVGNCWQTPEWLEGHSIDEYGTLGVTP